MDVLHAQNYVLALKDSKTLPIALAYAQYVICGETNNENTSGNASWNLKFNNFSHPGLHFAFPVTTSDKVKSKPVLVSILKIGDNF